MRAFSDAQLEDGKGGTAHTAFCSTLSQCCGSASPTRVQIGMTCCAGKVGMTASVDLASGKRPFTVRKPFAKTSVHQSRFSSDHFYPAQYEGNGSAAWCNSDDRAAVM